MSQTSEFDAFYGHARRPLLLQALVLTGDPARASAATVEAFEKAWSRWSHVRRTDAPEVWTRRRAYGRAEQAVGAGPAGTPAPDAEQTALLRTVRSLDPAQRAAWALVEVAGLDVASAAAELGRSAGDVSTDLTFAREALAHPLGRAHESLPATDDPWTPQDVVVLDDLARRVGLPTPPQLRARRGSSGVLVRRVVPAVAAVSLVALVGGLLVASGGQPDAFGGPVPGSPADAVDAVPATVLLGVRDLASLGPGGWEAAVTTSTATDSGPGSLCQQAVSADPAALGVQNRRFRSGTAAAEETVVVSRSTDLALATYARTVGWWSGCTGVPVLLGGAYEVEGVGEESLVLTLRSWREPTASYSVALARDGATTVSLVSVDPVAGVVANGPEQPGTPQESAAALTRALATACRAEAAQCTATSPGDDPVGDGSAGAVSLTRVTPPAPPGSRGLLTPIDLPPPGDVSEPWAATPPASATGELLPEDEARSSTPCDEISLADEGAGTVYSRTFVMPGDPDLPVYFGLAETAGDFATEAEAAALVDKVVERFATCRNRIPSAVVADLGSELVDDEAGADQPVQESAAWGLALDVSSTERIFVRTAVVRNGTAVAQLTFEPGPSSDMTPAQFEALVVRARARLADIVSADLPS